MPDSRRLVDKPWSYCNVLRDDGVGVIEYTDQLAYLLFLKMARERATRRLNPSTQQPRLATVEAGSRRPVSPCRALVPAHSSSVE
jgi:hypothetical protein